VLALTFGYPGFLLCVWNVSMNSPNVKIVSWNVRGLNATARCLAVHETLAATPCQIVCLQETKLHMVDPSLTAFLGAYKLDKFAFKPAVGTKGGILLLWKDAEVDLSNVASAVTHSPRRSPYGTA
jgi:exonuclease III